MDRVNNPGTHVGNLEISLDADLEQGGMENAELPLVDVNSDTVSQTWPLLLLAVKQAHFISLDLVRVTQPRYVSLIFCCIPVHITFHFLQEFSGLGSISKTGKGEM